MLRRTKRLQSICNLFCSEYGLIYLGLDQDEWRQVDYLLCLTQLFFTFTNAVSKTRDVTVHVIFEIYNCLFEHLERSIRQLQQKKTTWKKLMLAALYAAKDKLSFYYAKTDEVHDDLFALGTNLVPENKLKFFSGKDWDNGWRQRYRQSLEKYFEPYKICLANTQTSLQTQPSPLAELGDINILLRGAKRQ